MSYMTVHFSENGIHANFFTYYDNAKQWQLDMAVYGYPCGIYALQSDRSFVLLSMMEGEDKDV